MKALTNTTRYKVGGAAIVSLHPFGWRRGGFVCLGQSSKPSANSIMLTSNIVTEQVPSDYRLFEHC
ncbi:MAG TPA: hypothetical protein VFZ34_23770 [Blastocatellia bacterium]|nr:hypothetical protein [Blastocatellia bacterium]